MSSTLTLPPVAPSSPWIAPTPRSWTVEEFNRLGDLGLFEGRRAILMDGIILEWGPMNPPHRIALELVDAWIRTIFTTGWRISIQMPLHLNTKTDPQPDIAVYRGNPRDSASHPTNPVLVVEVSDTSLTYDLTEKAEKYAEAGIADYWVLDVAGRRLLVFRDPQPVAANGNIYRTHLTLGPNDTIAPLAAPTATVRVADLLP